MSINEHASFILQQKVSSMQSEQKLNLPLNA